MKPNLYLVKLKGGKKARMLRVLADNEREAERASRPKPKESIVSIKKLGHFEQKVVELTTWNPREEAFAPIIQRTSQLLAVKVPIKEALSLQIASVKNIKTRYVLLKIIEALDLGKSMEAAFREHKGIFSESFLAMIGSAEKSNEVISVFKRIGTSFEKKSKLFKKLIGKLIYPAMVFVISIVVILVFSFKCIPKLEEMYAGSGVELPILTQIVSKGVHFCTNYPFVNAIPAIMLYGFFRYRRWVLERPLTQNVLYAFPKLGKFLWQKEIVGALDTMVLLFSSKISVGDTLAFSVKGAKSHRLGKLLTQVQEETGQGESFSHALFSVSEDIGSQGEELATIASIGERSGELAGLLDHYSKNAQEEIDYQVENFNKLIGPMMTLFLGALGLFVALTMMYPISKLMFVMIKQGMSG